MKNLNLGKTKKLIIILIILLFILFIIYAVKNTKIIKNILGIDTKQESERTLPEFSYMVYDNRDEEKIKVLVTANSNNGLEYIEYPDGRIINGNGKSKIEIDYLVKKGENYTFKIKENNENIKEKKILVTDEKIRELVNMEISQNTGYKTIKISENMNLNGFKTYYQIGKNGEWVEGKGKISVLDYDVTTNNLINTDETITISAMVKNNSTEDTVLISENYKVDTSATLSSFEANSLLEAMEKYDFGTGKYKVSVSDETYNLKVYSFDENIEIGVDTQFGTEEDVGAANKYAQNMIVVKVNGNLTIDQGATCRRPKCLFMEKCRWKL